MKKSPRRPSPKRSVALLPSHNTSSSKATATATTSSTSRSPSSSSKKTNENQKQKEISPEKTTTTNKKQQQQEQQQQSKSKSSSSHSYHTHKNERVSPTTEHHALVGSHSSSSSALGGGGSSAANAQGGSGVPHTKRTQPEIDFDKYRLLDKLQDSEAMGILGFTQLCSDLGIAPPLQSADCLILSWMLSCNSFPYITKSEYLHAMHVLKVEHIGELRNSLKQYIQRVRDPESDSYFVDMYETCYDFLRDGEDRFLPFDKALIAWKVLLSSSNTNVGVGGDNINLAGTTSGAGTTTAATSSSSVIYNRYPLASHWISWVSTEFRRPITRDIWKSVLEVLRTTNDVSEYDSDGVFPATLDDFIMATKQKIQATAAALLAAKIGSPSSVSSSPRLKKLT